MQEHMTTGLRNDWFAEQEVKGWNKLIGEVYEVGTARKLKEKLGNLWLAAAE